MARIVAKDRSGNGVSSREATNEPAKSILIYNSALGETGDIFWARDFPEADIFILDVDVGAGDTVVLEVRGDSTAAWAIEQTITVDTSFNFTPSDQFRLRRTVIAATTKAWLTPRRVD